MASATRIVGIDFGLQRIGIAISDETKTIAFPLLKLQASKKMEETIARLIQELEKDKQAKKYALAEIVVGMPLLMSGKTGLMADEVNHFVRLLQAECGCPVTTWDERLTSVQADRSLRESSLTRKGRSKAVDTVSAVIILQNYLDRKKLSTEL